MVEEAIRLPSVLRTEHAQVSGRAVAIVGRKGLHVADIQSRDIRVVEGQPGHHVAGSPSQAAVLAGRASPVSQMGLVRWKNPVDLRSDDRR